MRDACAEQPDGDPRQRHQDRAEQQLHRGCILDALGGAIATSDHTARFWNKGGRPSTVLSTEQKVGTEDKRRIKEDWSKLYAGQDGEMIAVLDQDLKANFLTHDMRQSQFLATRQFQVVEGLVILYIILYIMTVVKL